MSVRTIVLAAAFGALIAGHARAQTQPPPDVPVRLTVVDSAGGPVRGADVSIVRGLHEIVGHGMTDAAGRATILVTRDMAELQAAARRVGFEPATRFFTVSAGDGIDVALVLRRTVQSLAPVKVTAAEDAKRKSYHLDADVIANSSRPLFDAMDVVTKLIPDIMDGRTGKGFDCGVQDVWVNGMRILFPPSNDIVQARIGKVPPPAPAPTLVLQGDGGSGRRLPMTAVQRVDSTVWLTLASIKPEHIAEMTYEDCFSKVVTDRTHASRALFVVLKPGVGYDTKHGSYVVASEDSKTRVGAARTSVLPTPPPASIPAYRARILGVYDASTGDPLEHVTVGDLSTGTSAETTITGTVSLAFLPEGSTVLVLTKPGYGNLRLDVTISPRDSVPLTLVMTRAASRDTTRVPRGGVRTRRQDDPGHIPLRTR